MHPASDKTTATALLILRLTLGLFLLLWSIEKLILPSAAAGIAAHFYGVTLPPYASYALGIVELLISLGIVLGAWRTVSYGLGLLIHTVTVIVSWRQLLDPWGFAKVGNHLWIATWPAWGGFVALFLMRERDAYSVDAWRRSHRA